MINVTKKLTLLKVLSDDFATSVFFFYNTSKPFLYTTTISYYNLLLKLCFHKHHLKSTCVEFR